MNLLNESQIFETWAPMIEEKTGITESNKLKWMTKYAHFHSLNEGFSYPQASLLNTPGMGNVATGDVAGGAGQFYNGSKGSGDKFPSLLPLAIQVAARTIGFDIVSVVPMNGPAGVLTYLDYVYAGGRDPLTTPPGTDIGGKNEKALIFKVQRNGFTSTADYTTITTGLVGAQYVFESSLGSLLVAFVGKSRIDGAAIFKVVAEGNSTTPIVSGVGNFAAGAWPAQPQGISLADVLDGNATDLYEVTGFSGLDVTGVTQLSTVDGSAELVKALEDHIAGFVGAGPLDTDAFSGNATNGTAAYEPMRRGIGETSYYRTMGLQAFTKFVEAETFQVAAQVTTEQIQDLNRQYGIDVVSMVENQLVNEVSQSINKHILSRAFALGWQNHVNFFLVEGKDLNQSFHLAAATLYTTEPAGAPGYIGQDNIQLPWPTAATAGNIPQAQVFGSPGFENLGTIQRRIQSRVLAGGNIVAQRGRRGPANFVVTNLQIATALQDSAQFTFYPMANTVNQNNGALYPLGTLAGMTIYVDPNMDFNDTRVLVGRKGADEEPGLKFMPYLMAESIQTIAEGTMSPKIAIKSRYALAEAGFHPETQYFTMYFHTGAASII